jgi:hypothetical protein
MPSIPAMRRVSVRSILGFLRRSPDRWGATVLAGVGLVLFVFGCDSRQLTPSPDAGPSTNACATVGCAAPPLCSTGCQATCGCCTCAQGERNGDLVCTSRGCYAPAPNLDGSADTSVDGGDVCTLPFEAGPCEAAIAVYAAVGGDCVPRTYGGCQGNGNRFSTLEACVSTCLSKAVAGCPPNRVLRELCLACGLAGGCAKMASVCALVCSPGGDASVCPPSMICYDGVCQYAALCI